MDYPKFIVSNQREESISIQRVKPEQVFMRNSRKSSDLHNNYGLIEDYKIYQKCEAAMEKSVPTIPVWGGLLFISMSI